MDMEELGLGGPELLDGERVAARMRVSPEEGKRSRRKAGVLALTNERIVYMSGEDKGVRTTMVSVQDVESVTVRTIPPEGIGSYVWAALSVALSVALYSYIEHAVWRIAAALAVLAMGGYLVIDRLTDRGRTAAIFKARDSEIRWHFDYEKESSDVYEFINALYRVKMESSRGMDEWLSLR